MTSDPKYDNETLIQENKRLRKALEQSISGLVIVDRGGKIKYVNAHWADMHGYEPVELLNQSIHVFSDNEEAHKIWFDQAVGLVDSEDGYSGECKHRTKEGESKYLWLKIYPGVQSNQGEKEYVIAGNNISEQKLAQEQFVKYAPAAIAMFDTDMKYMMVSDKWYVDYNLQGQEIIGKSHYEVFPEVGDDWKQIHRRCLEGAVERNDSDRFLRRDGREQWLEWEIRPWRKNTEEVGGIIMFTNEISETIKQHRELESKNKDLEKLNKLMIDRELRMVELKKAMKKMSK